MNMLHVRRLVGGRMKDENGGTFVLEESSGACARGRLTYQVQLARASE